MAQRGTRLAASPLLFEQRPVSITASIGAGTMRRDSDKANDDARQALYGAVQKAVDDEATAAD